LSLSDEFPCPTYLLADSPNPRQRELRDMIRQFLDAELERWDGWTGHIPGSGAPKV